MQGAGLFSKLGGYVGGAHAAAAGLGTGMRTLGYGAAAGAVYGTTMGDSILGGAAAGAALAYGGRMGRAAARGAGAYMRSNGPASLGGLGLNMRMAAQSRAMRDASVAGSRALRSRAGRYSVMQASRGINRVVSSHTFKNAVRWAR